MSIINKIVSICVMMAGATIGGIIFLVIGTWLVEMMNAGVGIGIMLLMPLLVLGVFVGMFIAVGLLVAGLCTLVEENNEMVEQRFSKHL